MSYRSTRDWRGIKHHLGQYSVDDLQALLKNAEAARDQLTDFVTRVTVELAARDVAAQRTSG